MNYTSTRDSSKNYTSSQAILTGLSPDGGLLVPTEFKTLDIKALKGKGYQEIALEVLKVFLTDYDTSYLKESLKKAYGENFGGKAGELVKLDDNLYSLELWHGPTAAFKDYALQFMPHLLVEARRLQGETGETIILVATSGDTGKAALEGYKDIDGIKITVFYPEDGTSEVQRLQMVTQDGENVSVYAVKGNFDDAQTGVKIAFCDEELQQKLAQENKHLSSANSINWGRLVPQIVYYVTSYINLWEQGRINYGDEVDFCVPTGNFGDIMAGYFAKMIGLPVGKLVCASNQNNVLSDFLLSGTYSVKRRFYKTSSPSMDIIVSSNLERLLYYASGCSADKVSEWMGQLAADKEYTIDSETLNNIKACFSAGWADENQVAKEIRHIKDKYNYLCDPHTAVAFSVAERMEHKTGNPVVVLSTASPFKFSGKVLNSLGLDVPEDEFEALQALENATGLKAPESISRLREKEVRFSKTILPSQIPDIPLTL